MSDSQLSSDKYSQVLLTQLRYAQQSKLCLLIKNKEENKKKQSLLC